MRFQGLSLQLAALSVLLPVSDAFSVTTTNDANSLANAILGQGITLLQASFSGAAISSGSFSDGPFGIGSGAILTSGSAVGALPNGDHYVNNGAPGSDTYCGPNTFNAALLTVDFFLNPTYSGIRVEFIFASEEEGGSADPMGIFIGGTQYAKDNDGQRITATNRYILRPLAITPPNSVTSYPGSSPPLLVDILTSGAQTMVIAICDQGDSEWDSAVLIKAEGCVDCDTDMRLAYVTTTTTLDAGEVPYTSTITASGTVSGTIEIGVLAATTEVATTTADDGTTTTTADSTTTAVDGITTTTAEEATSTTAEEPTTTTTDIEITTTTEEIMTTAEEITTTAADETTTTADETTTTAVNGITTTTTTTEEVPTTTAEEPVTTTATDGTTTTADSEATTTTHESSAGSTSDDPTTTTEESPTESTSDKHQLTTTQDTTTTGTTEVSTEANDTVTRSEPLPNTTTTALATSDATTEASTIGTESSVITTTSQEPSSEITTGTETTNISDAPVDRTTTSSNDGETPSASSTISASSNAETESSSSGISTDDNVVPNSGTKTTTESIETTTVHQIEPSTNTIPTAEVTTSNSVQTTSNPTIPLSASTSTESFINSAITIGSSVCITQSQGGGPISPPVPTTYSFNAGNSTRTEDVVVPIVTTITYMVVDPNDPSHLTMTEFCSTLRPSPCRNCQYQRPTTVEMTTVTVDCNACGHSGENTVILEVPAGAAVATQTRDHAAHETHHVQHHQPNPYRQRPRPSKGDSQTWEMPRPQHTVTVAGDKPYEGNEGYKFDHPQSDHVESSDAEGGHKAPKPVETIKTEPKPANEPADVIKPEAKPTTVGGNDQPEPLEPTFQRRPVPAPTPMTPDSPVVVVSAAVKTMDGMLVSMFCLTGVLLLL
ncbi:hypothetical protein FPSE_09552 [Fusarium pseudograminearum CS3096]|uniref:Uncharacterized protein n=1 Tax=Fusarium pseudograminearum (strain CS3096) TaxID=1028729 RepID=K3VYB0_FUSPC|nr:hypothetical protein FPSE_09552 [Fusarium pseudograminearum CS3096]EKJ70335.1 hypothetical protein FPSE_09552 [Fusarium pseudograminearum CS3096]